MKLIWRSYYWPRGNTQKTTGSFVLPGDQKVARNSSTILLIWNHTEKFWDSKQESWTLRPVIFVINKGNITNETLKVNLILIFSTGKKVPCSQFLNLKAERDLSLAEVRCLQKSKRRSGEMMRFTREQWGNPKDSLGVFGHEPLLPAASNKQTP